MIAELDKEKDGNVQAEMTFAQNLKSQIAGHEETLDKLLDLQLSGTIFTEEYTAKKQKILNQKIEISEKLRDFERKGNRWLVSLTQRLEKNDKLNTGEPAHSVSESFDVRRSSIWYFPGI